MLDWLRREWLMWKKVPLYIFRPYAYLEWLHNAPTEELEAMVGPKCGGANCTCATTNNTKGTTF